MHFCVVPQKVLWRPKAFIKPFEAPQKKCLFCQKYFYDKMDLRFFYFHVTIYGLFGAVSWYNIELFVARAKSRLKIKIYNKLILIVIVIAILVYVNGYFLSLI